MYLKSYFVNRARRDAYAADLKSRGYRVTRSSTHGSVLSPDYVEDYDGPRRDNGFGRAAPSYFAVLYIVETD